MYVEQEVPIIFVPSIADSRERRECACAGAGQQQHSPVINRGKERDRSQDADGQYSRGEVTSRRVIGRSVASAVDLPGVAEPRFIDSRSISAGNSPRSRFHHGDDGKSHTHPFRRLAHAVRKGGKIQKQCIIGGSVIFLSRRVIIGRANKSSGYWHGDLVGGIFGGL